VQIPYEGGTMPGWLFRPGGATTVRPTLVVVNGSDGPRSGAWAVSGGAAVKRGYNVLLFDGPGQQSMLFDRNVPFRPDWEHVLGPVYDFVSVQPAIDPTRIALYGWSQGGYWVPRALTVDHRYCAAIADPGVVDVSTSWTSQIPGPLLAMYEKGEAEKFDKDMALGMKLAAETARTWAFRARPYGAQGYAATLDAVRQYSTAQTAAAITTPLLITAPEHEQFWPGQAQQLGDLTTQVSTVLPFTAAEGADLHCEPLARSVAAQRMFDWLDDRVRDSPRNA
jgi:dienelactone hydrolase